jgi:predicted Zn-dependent peptidase
VDVAFNDGQSLSNIIFAIKQSINKEAKHEAAVLLLEELDRLREKKEKYISKEVIDLAESAEYQTLLEKIEDREKMVDKLLS